MGQPIAPGYSSRALASAAMAVSRACTLSSVACTGSTPSSAVANAPSCARIDALVASLISAMRSIAWCAVMASPRESCNALQAEASRARERSSPAAMVSNLRDPGAARASSASKARFTCATNAVLVAWSACRSRAKQPSPALLSRSLTTSSAALFSAMNSTRFPCARLSQSRLVMVWLLPVPGGPCSTKVAPLTAEQIAAICDESAASGRRTVVKGAPASISSAVISGLFGMDFDRSRPISVLTTGCSTSFLAFLRISWNSGNFLNE